MKILLSAYCCGATWTSEPGVAWRAVHHALGNNHEVWAIITQDGYERELGGYLAEHPLPGFHPIFLDLSPFLQLLRGSGLTRSFYYNLWQHKLLDVARRLHEKVGFDLTHHVTFARYWSPSGVRNLGIPFIWGPVGAAESAPPAFLAGLSPRERLFEFARDNVRVLARLDPTLRATARAATIAIGITRETCQAIRELGAKRVEQLPLSLSDDELAAYDRVPPPPPGPFRAMCLGRLLHWKGFQFAIRAFALFARKNPEAELWIVGDGRYRSKLEQVAAQTGLGSRIRFLGMLSHAVAMERLVHAHVLMHPAIHEAFGYVCLEAMASGRPVVCLDVGGPAMQVTRETGFVAPATTPEESIQAMASYLHTIDNDRALLAKISDQCRARVRAEFTMRRTGDIVDSFYTEAVASHRELSRFGSRS
jgi:glycosyltransferase involved in cell wall biosynthesis